MENIIESKSKNADDVKTEILSGEDIDYLVKGFKDGDRPDLAAKVEGFDPEQVTVEIKYRLIENSESLTKRVSEVTIRNLKGESLFYDNQAVTLRPYSEEVGRRVLQNNKRNKINLKNSRTDSLAPIED